MGEEKNTNDIIYLGEKELELFKILRKNSADLASWISTEEISKEMKLKDLEVKKLISSLRRTNGITLSSNTKKISEKEKITKYGLAPETLEVLVKSGNHSTTQNKLNYCALYMGKPAFGTKAFDEKYTMKGLSLVLETNNLSKEIMEVIIQGGIIPTVPPYSSVSYMTALKFLGQVDRTDSKRSISEKMLEEEIKSPFERRYYEKFINNGKKKKITNLTEAFGAAEKQISILMDTLPEETVLRMQLGHEERENIRFLEQALIQEFSKKKTERIKKMKIDLQNDSTTTYIDSYNHLLKKDFLEEISKSKNLKKKAGESKREYFERISKHLEEKNSNVEDKLYKIWKGYNLACVSDSDLEKMKEKTIEEVIKYSYYWTGRNPNKIDSKVKDLNLEIEKFPRKKRDLISRLEDINLTDSWTKQLLSGDRAAITWFTQQYPVDADFAELGWKKVKDKFTKHFFEWEISNPTVVHVSPRKKVVIDTGIVTNLKTGEKDKVEVEYNLTTDGKKKIMMIENINHIFSNDISAKGIKVAKSLLNYETIVLNKLYEKEVSLVQPDIVLLGGHLSGGFRAMPWFKESEQLIEGEFVGGQEISWMINLPTMQSIPNLEKLASRGFRNWDIKRYLKGPYGSAAIVHSEDKEGVDRFYIFDTGFLKDMGKVAEEIDKYRNELKNEKNLETRKNILGAIKEAKSKAKANFHKIEAGGDFHLLSPDILERYSKEQLILAAQSYQRRHGLPNIVAYDEILNGVEERIFKSSTRYEAKPPAQFKQQFILPILKDENISWEEKAHLIAKESLANLRAIPGHNISHQKDEHDFMIKPYLLEVLPNAEAIIYTSGNHANQSQRLSDEAQELAGRYDKNLIYGRYNKKGKIHIHSGRGNPIGVGTMILKGDAKQKLFTMHKFPSNMDEGYGALVHLRSGKNDADIVIYGDRHHPIACYADGHLVVQHPGMEPINTYVPLIGKPAGIHGINNIYYDPDKRGIYGVDFILDKTLEKIIQTEKII